MVGGMLMTGRMRAWVVVALCVVSLALPITGCGQSEGRTDGELPDPDMPYGVQTSVEAHRLIDGIDGISTGESTWNERREEARWRTTGHDTYVAEITPDGVGEYRTASQVMYGYDDDGRMAFADDYGEAGAHVSLVTWEYDGNQVVEETTRYSNGEESSREVTTTVEEEDGSSRSETRDAAGAPISSTEMTVEQDGDGSTETVISRDGNGTIVSAVTREFDAAGNLASYRTYEGDPATSPAQAEVVYEYDDEGRMLGSVRSDLADPLYGDDAWLEYSTYPEFGEVTLHASGSSSGMSPDSFHFTVRDQQGNITYCFEDLDPDDEMGMSSTAYYIDYDGFGNPTELVRQDGGITTEKQVFDYDDYGNLLSAATVTFIGPEMPSQVEVDVYSYAGDDDDAIEAVDPETVEIPEYTEDDSTYRLIYTQGTDFVEPMMDGGAWVFTYREADEETGMPAGLVTVAWNEHNAGRELWVGTVDEGGMAYDTNCLAQCYTAPDGSVYVAGYDGTRIVMTPAGEGAMEVEGALADGTPVDAVAEWDASW